LADQVRDSLVLGLERVFQRQLDCAPQRWLNEQRILAARQMLQDGNPVKKVAFDLGFKQSSHFCRQFKSFTGNTPSQFKNSNVETSDVAGG